MVLKERVRLNERLRRLGKAFVDGLADESDYTLQKKLLQYQLDGLVMPEADAAFDAGEKLENLGAVWEAASLQDKHALLLSMLDAVYLDLAQTQSVVGIRPKRAVLSKGSSRSPGVVR